MANLKDVIAYICKNYPYKNELSKARLTKLVYLVDWKMSIDEGHQATPIRWLFNHFGPYVPDVETLARTDDEFNIETTSNYYGRLKEVVSLNVEPSINLSPVEIEKINFTIEQTKSLSWDSFIKLVYSTYPILVKSRFEYLDLPQIAFEYKSKISGQS